MSIKNTCGQCKFWVRQEQQSLDLSQPRMGECMRFPPQMHLMQVVSNQGVGVQATTSYPQLPHTFKACLGEFKPKEVQ